MATYSTKTNTREISGITYYEQSDAWCAITDGRLNSGDAAVMFSRNFCREIAADPDTNIYELLRAVDKKRRQTREMQNDFAINRHYDRAKEMERRAINWDCVFTNLYEFAI